MFVERVDQIQPHLGFAPAQVKEMSFWEFAACVDGWNRSQGGGYAHTGEPISDDEYDAACEAIERMNNGRS